MNGWNQKLPKGSDISCFKRSEQFQPHMWHPSWFTKSYICHRERTLQQMWYRSVKCVNKSLYDDNIIYSSMMFPWIISLYQWLLSQHRSSEQIIFIFWTTLGIINISTVKQEHYMQGIPAHHYLNMEHYLQRNQSHHGRGLNRQIICCAHNFFIVFFCFGGQYPRISARWMFLYFDMVLPLDSSEDL